ncbi:MAG: hypothetical protein AB8G23_05875 [Myxococcota bacterium]
MKQSGMQQARARRLSSEFESGVRARWMPLQVAWLLLSLFVFSTFPGAAFAQSEQLYFLGTTAARGSISAEASGVDVVYLRWDALEGNLPDDVLQLRIERDAGTPSATPIADFTTPHAVMDAPQIAALYLEPGQDRRRREIVRSLEDYLEAGITEGNFATQINLLIDPTKPDSYERFWTFFASRNDINVARARYRAFIDTTAPVGTHVYTLYASNGVSEVKVGQVSVDVGVRKPIPEAVNLRKVPIGRCDAPEGAKGHGALALTWDHPGNNLSDIYGSALMISGYDLYRAAEPLCEGCTLTPRNIEGEASVLPHDAEGNVSIPGLVKVNNVPIVIAGNVATDEVGQQYTGYNDPYYHMLVTAPEVAAMGLKPGDEVPFYLVARDFTGNYGATHSAAIVIPDKLRPPAPWNITTESKTFVDLQIPNDAPQLRVVWDHVNVVNFHNDYKLDRTYCNLETARFDRELRYVPEGGECETDPQISVELDVKKYLVYRFESQGEATRFQDSDGDGYSDALERDAVGAPDSGFTLPAEACEPGLFPADPSQSRLVGEVETNQSPDQIQRPSGRVAMQFIDTHVPSEPLDTIYWYRVAAYTELPGGERKLSELSAPVRGLFHDRALPQRDDCGEIGLTTREDCEYGVTIIPPEPSADPVTARDDTPEQAAAYIEVSCTDPFTGQAVLVTQPVTGDPAAGEDRTATLSNDQCGSLLPTCVSASDFELRFYDSNGTLLGSDLYDQGQDVCPLGTGVLDSVCTDRPVRHGETLAGPPLVENTCADDTLCTTIYQEIGENSYKVATHCAPDPFPGLNLPGLSGEICLSYTLQDENNNVSAKTYFPCFHLPTIAPDAPQAVSFTFGVGNQDATMQFVPPEQPVAGTLLEWRQAGASKVETVFSSHDGLTARDGVRAENILLPTPAPVGDEQEEWCFRARAVTRDGEISDWSPRRCDLRLPAGVEYPEYMPWPKIASPSQGGSDLRASYFQADQRIVIGMGDPIASFGSCGEPSYLGETCSGESTGGGCIPNPGTGFFASDCNDFCSAVLSSRTEPLRFVAYRQSGSMPDDPDASEFQQVSPLIDHVACHDVTLGAVTQLFSDPFLKLVELTSPHPWSGSGPQMVFLDRSPHIQSRWYRYQFVYFDSRGEIESYRNSNWVQAQ